MYINRIDFLQSELEISSGCYKGVSQRTIVEDSRVKYYNPRSSKMKNYSGGQIEYCLFTENERNAYLLSGEVMSDLSYLDNSEDETINNLRGSVRWVFAKQVDGETLSSGCSCIIIQE